MLAGHLAPRHYTPSRSDSLTFYSSEEGQCGPATKHPDNTLISAGFTYELQRTALAGY